MPSHGRFRKRHHAALVGASLGALLLPLAAVTLPASSAGASTTAPACAQPVVREAMVSQGLPTYRALARGKHTLVKLFLSQKSGCTATIKVTGATLRVVAGGASPQNVGLANTATLVELPAYNVAAASASNGDPYFAVPGSVLSPPSAGSELSSYTASFSAVLTYTSVHNGVTYTGQQIAVDNVNGAAISATVERASKPLRVLVVPMGDAAAGYARVFPDTANSTLRNAMQAVHRLLPVTDGIGTVESGAGGLRYSVAPSQQLVNLGMHEEKSLTSTKSVSYLDANGLYCGKEGSFVYIQQKLAEARTAWNSVHSADHDVDRVLGVVVQENSIGSTTHVGSVCAEGYAGVNAPEAWFRLVHSSAGSTPRHLAGYLATMELGHTIGAVPTTRGTSSYHSFNDEADGTARERAYNTTRGEYRNDDRSAMKFNNVGWHDDNVFLEKADWDHAHCVLVTGADASTACSGTQAVVGSTTGAAGVLHAAGVTDGTPGGTNLHTYVVSNQEYERPPANGAYFVRFFLGPLRLRDQAVPVHFTHSHHSGGSTGGTSPKGIFDVAIDAAGADSFQFLRRDPVTGAETVLFNRRLDQKPQITQVRRADTTARSPYANTTASEGIADISPDGKYVVWGVQDDGGEDGLHVRRTTDTSGPDLVLPFGYQPDWSSSGDRIAYLRAGRLVIAELDTSAATGPPALRAERELYVPEVVDGSQIDSALHPSWSADDRQIAVSLDRSSIHVLDATMERVSCVEQVGCRELLRDFEREVDWPAWSPPRRDAPDGLIAFERQNSDGIRYIHTLDPSAAEVFDVQRFQGSAPAWGGGRLAYTLPDGTGIGTVAETDFLDPQRIVSEPGDDHASLTRDGELVVYTGSSRETGFDIFIVRPTPARSEVVVTDDRPQDLRMDVFLVCDGSAAPVATGLYPRAAGTETVFDVTIDETAACPDATPLYRATDGFQTASRQDAVVLPGRTQPVVAVAAPRPGDQFNEHAPVPVDLDGWAPDGSRLPVTYTVAGAGTAVTLTSSAAETADLVSYLPPGSYTLTATAAHGGSTATTVVPFTILGDTDRDGLPDAEDSPSVHHCYPADARTSARNAVTDYDGDLLIGRSDADPCRTAFTAAVLFEPQTVLLGSTGTQLTFTITSKLDPNAITAAGTRITRMAGYPVDLQAVSAAVVDHRTVTVKFDRQAYSNLARSRGLTTGYVPVTVTLSTPSGAAQGADPQYPIHKS